MEDFFNDNRAVQRIKDKINLLEIRIDKLFVQLDKANKLVGLNTHKVKTLNDFFNVNKLQDDLFSQTIRNHVSAEYLLPEQMELELIKQREDEQYIEGILKEIRQYETIIKDNESNISNYETEIDALTKKIIDLKVNLNWLRD